MAVISSAGKRAGTARSTLPKAIYQSCDVFFYTLAERLGIERIAKYATALGLGQKTGIDLPQEVSGVMPSEEWKLKNYRQKWFAGETISVGIGQGAVAMTPVQLMRAISAISMGGHMVRPHVVFPDRVPETYRTALHYTDTQDIPIDPEGWETITDAMSAGAAARGHGAQSAHRTGLDIAGKTGSAQTISNALKSKMSNKVRMPTRTTDGSSVSPRAATRTWWSAFCLRAASTERWRHGWRPR